MSVLAAAIISAALYASHIYVNRADGFRVEKVLSDLQPDHRWDVLGPSLEQMNATLSQEFEYIGKGAQCFVFGSHDGQHVIKLFKNNHVRPLFYASSAVNLKRESKLEKWFSSLTTAYREAGPSTGLVYLHLNKTEGLFSEPLRLVDSAGGKHALNLDRLEFVVQRRGTLLFEAVEQAMQAGEAQRAQDALVGVGRLIFSRCLNGVRDTDPAIGQNYGVDASGAPLQLDVGRCRKIHEDSRERVAVEALTHYRSEIETRIGHIYPELVKAATAALDV